MESHASGTSLQRSIRVAGPSDFAALADVMFDSVRNGPSLYTAEQRQAWVPEVRGGSDWNQRLSNQTIVLAEQQGTIAGYMSIAANGYVDLAFIRPSYQGTGLFRQLFDRVQSIAIDAGENRLWVHASLMAQPAFTAVGFEIVKEETVEVRGQTLRRFEMQKCLAPQDSSSIKSI